MLIVTLLGVDQLLINSSMYLAVIATTLGTMSSVKNKLSLRSRLACTAADLATWASKKSGRGAGGMIGGLIANAIDPHLMEHLAQGRPVVLVTGTNGKSTTTRMLTAALRTRYTVGSNEGGDNMDAGIISALLAHRDAEVLALEVDELHVPAIADKLNAQALVLLNLSRDQLDRVGEINKIENALRECVNNRPNMTVIANCDDVPVSSVAWDSPRTIWVSAGTGWSGDSTSCPRTDSPIIFTEETAPNSDDEPITTWKALKPLPDGSDFARPTPQWSVTRAGIHTPEGDLLPLSLSLPGRANRGNATQALVAALSVGAELDSALGAIEKVSDVAGRYSTINFEGRQVHLMLAKNPAGWQEALSMVDRTADALVIAVNGQVADGQDLSWLWDVRFESFDTLSVVVAGERSADLAVRLSYAGVEHSTISDPLEAIRACPSGRVELLANYTSFRDIKKALDRATHKAG